MSVELFQVDAFAGLMFEGNPAAVVPLEQWPSDQLLQNIAAENNLAETAFLVGKGQGNHHLRWFTPAVEVPLCGHATLAAAHILWTELSEEAPEIRFETLSGELIVTRAGEAYRMDFPADPPKRFAIPDGLEEALGAPPKDVFAGQYVMAVFPSAEDVADLSPDFRALARIEVPRNRGAAENCVVVTAPGAGGLDFVSRFFGPTVGIDEDPVTGSAHCMLAPFWAGELGRTTLKARQISARGGNVGCVVEGDRVLLDGTCVTYLRGEIAFPDSV